MCDSPFYVTPKGHFKAVPVPCGRCPPCKQRRVNGWVFRLQQEDFSHESSHFVTLTYNTDTVPISDRGRMTLRKRDVQLFFKRLRKDTGLKLKYYAVGEYGTKNWRPHYHIILFGLNDVKEVAPDVFTSQALNRAWTSGAIHIGKVSGASIAYTCKYVNKPTRVPAYRGDDRVKEFSLMSKGLGARYLTDAANSFHNVDISRNYVVAPGGHKLAMPRFYREKLFSEEVRERQRYLAEQVQLDKDSKARDYYARTYGDDTEDGFLNYQYELRVARHSSFYKKQLPRDFD